MSESKKSILGRSKLTLVMIYRRIYDELRQMFAETLGLGHGATITTIVFAVLVIVSAFFWFIYSRPPRTITITSGKKGSVFYQFSEKYARILARNHITLNILPSWDSKQNLERLENPSFDVDIGFVQSGIAKGHRIDSLVSMGSIAYEPILIFYRGDRSLEMISQFEGKRLSIGKAGTATQMLALEILALNGIRKGGRTTLLEMDDEESDRALVDGTIDAAFMMSDSASTRALQELMFKPGIRVFNFTQADAYTRRLPYLNNIVIPKGTVDLGRNIPDRDVNLVSPTVELIARSDLHPAISDLLMEAITEVHAPAAIAHKRGEFPVLIEQEYRISDDAARFQKSGKSFIYKNLPYRLSTIVSRLLVIFIPMVLVLIPGLKIIPALYRMRMRMRIRRWYHALLVLENELMGQVNKEDCRLLMEQLDQIEETVHNLKIPATYADQLYTLRSHVNIVRDRLKNIIGS